MTVTAFSSELRSALHKAARPVGFVPTMGALHAGHLSLVEAARRENQTVVVSIFVNPTQFNDPRDLQNYPRDVEGDLELLSGARGAGGGTAGAQSSGAGAQVSGVRAAGARTSGARADMVFVPPVEEIYPTPDYRVFDLGGVDKPMEGASRPGHFNGVAQVVSRLFDIVEPDAAYFGQKDFQQVAVVRRLVATLGYKVRIVACPTVRELDGLALSSRNLLLDPAHRAAAPLIYKTLREGATMRDKQNPAEVKEFVTHTINANPLLRVIYFQIVDALTLNDISSWGDAAAVQGCVAVQAGGVRLIDNIEF